MEKVIIFFVIAFYCNPITAQCWQSIVASTNHSIAMKTDGTLWGRNAYGQIGDGTLVDKVVSTQIGTDTIWVYISSSGGIMQA